MKRFALSWLVLLALCKVSATAQDTTGFQGTIKPFVKAY